MKFADVIVDISAERLDRKFQYRIPIMLEQSIHPGVQVEAPFGKGNRTVSGYVIRVTDKPDYELEKIKYIQGISQKKQSLEGRLIELAAWIRESYGCTMLQALKTVLPVRQKTGRRTSRRIVLRLSKEEASCILEEEKRRSHTARVRLLERLIADGSEDYAACLKELNLSASVVRALERKGVLFVEDESGDPYSFQEGDREASFPELTREQGRAVDEIWEEWHSKNPRPVLLHGVTGSGKTVVYMSLIAMMLEQGRQVILLVPEIALTYQNVQRFCECFGKDVAIIHSRLSQGERAEQFGRAARGEARIMIGPRSALFAPFPSLGLIIVDEEQEGSYHSEMTPRYHARETAVKRAGLEEARVLLGSATPSMEARYRCETGEYREVRMTRRYGSQGLARVKITDMREELRKGNRSMLGSELRQSLTDCLARGEQAMLFLNRRGYAGFVSCRTCGYVIKCPHCDVSMTIHKHGRLVCHYCGHEAAAVHNCPSCGSAYIGGFRAGTQQMEEVLSREFPEARVLRMDMDTTRHKNDHEKLLRAFGEGQADILVGTQMIVKGHDFPRVTLVGALAADLSLYTGDYRAAERTFQLLTQAVGRAGRADRPGMAVIQTYHPEHYAIQAAARQDDDIFYEEELGYRRLMGYPPVENLLAIHASSADELRLNTAVEYLKRYLFRAAGREKVQIIGPADEAVSKVKDMYRKVIYVKHKAYGTLTRLKDKTEQYVEINSGFRGIYIQYDFNA